MAGKHDKVRGQSIAALNSLGHALEMICDQLDDFERRLQKLEKLSPRAKQ